MSANVAATPSMTPRPAIAQAARFIVRRLRESHAKYTKDAMAPSSPDRDCEKSRPASMRQRAIPSQIDLLSRAVSRSKGSPGRCRDCNRADRVPKRQAAAP